MEHYFRKTLDGIKRQKTKQKKYQRGETTITKGKTSFFCASWRFYVVKTLFTTTIWRMDGSRPHWSVCTHRILWCHILSLGIFSNCICRARKAKVLHNLKLCCPEHVVLPREDHRGLQSEIVVAKKNNLCSSCCSCSSFGVFFCLFL